MRIGPIDIDRPIILAPMEDVTDRAFRQLCKRHGADIVYTEFVSAEAIRRGAEKSIRKLRMDAHERPVAVQIFGNTVESMVEAAAIAESFEPDYLDINFGCPVKKVAGRGAGAALLKEPEKLSAIAAAVVGAVSLPVTAKTRIGWDHDSINITDTVRRLEDAGIQAVAVHGRTRSDMYKGRADWGRIAEAKRACSIPVIANGDVWSADDAVAMFAETGADGIMIGRGSIGNPFIFAQARASSSLAFACRFRRIATGSTPRGSTCACRWSTRAKSMACWRCAATTRPTSRGCPACRKFVTCWCANPTRW